MTPRLPLVTAALAAATLVSPASAATMPAGVWWGVDGYVYHGYAYANGVVMWPDLTSSWCSGFVSGSRGEITCTGDVSFSVTDCLGTTVWGVSMSVTCTTSTHYVEATAVMVGFDGPFTGTVSHVEFAR